MTDSDAPPLAFFENDGSQYRPLPYARSPWSTTMINGPAVCGLAAHEIEARHAEESFVPARLTVDLFRQARFEPTTVTTTVVRDGRRIRVVDASVEQDGQPVARATVVFLRRTTEPAGHTWRTERVPTPPMPVLTATKPFEHYPLYGSDDHVTEDNPGGWSLSMEDHTNRSRKRVWHRQLDVLNGHPNSPFVRAAMVGENTSMVTHWGSEGVGFINADLTMTLSRLPVGSDVGLEADNQSSTDGVSVGAATLFDTDGVFGTCLVTAVANPNLAMDFTRGR
ncbi:MAG: acyl-CoA thioesterase domain-containing protein [Rhodococcus sp. (in: high G+C Gram-positive bacteria)]